MRLFYHSFEQYWSYNDLHVSLQNALYYFRLFKTVLLKVVFAVVSMNLVLKIRKSLNDSTETSDNGRKGILYRRLLVFSLISFFVNVLFLIHDVLSFVAPHDRLNLKCKNESVLLRNDVQMMISAVIISVGSSFNFLGIIFLFEKARKFVYGCMVHGQNRDEQ